MKKLKREYNSRCTGSWRVTEFGHLIELENIKTGDRMTYEPTGYTAEDAAYIDNLCGYKEA